MIVHAQQISRCVAANFIEAVIASATFTYVNRVLVTRIYLVWSNGSLEATARRFIRTIYPEADLVKRSECVPYSLGFFTD